MTQEDDKGSAAMLGSLCLAPIEVPTAVLYDKKTGLVDLVPWSDIDAITISEACKAFRAAVFAAAKKKDPESSEPVT